MKRPLTIRLGQSLLHAARTGSAGSDLPAPPPEAQLPDAEALTREFERAQMHAAEVAARESMTAFLAALEARKAGQDHFAVKKPFEEGDEVEQLWLINLHYDGATLNGEVGNAPHKISNLHCGDAVSFFPDEISDWMFRDHGQLVGGYTIRVLYHRENLESRKRYERDLGVEIH